MASTCTEPGLSSGASLVPGGRIPSTPRERRHVLVQLLVRRGPATVDDLADRVLVSTSTVYRDLEVLAAAGLVRCHRGVVQAVVHDAVHGVLGFRPDEAERSEVAMARALAPRIEPGCRVALDASGTSVKLLQALEPGLPLQVVTNSLAVAQEATRHPGVRLVVTGGHHRPASQALTGPRTVQELQTQTADLCVVSAPAIRGGKCLDLAEDEAAVRRAMVSSAACRVLAAPSTVVDRAALHAFARVEEMDLVVTDLAVPTQQWLGAAVEVVVARP